MQTNFISINRKSFINIIIIIKLRSLIVTQIELLSELLKDEK